jgi:hypothetical protein
MRKIFQNKGAWWIMVIHRIVKCGLIGGFILFIWGAVSWTILPWQKSQMHRFSDEGDIRSAIKDNAHESGLYVMPNLQSYPRNSSDQADAKAKMEAGPFIVAAVSLDGRSSGTFGKMVGSLIVKIIAAGIATWLLIRSQYPHEYLKSVKYFTCIGFLIAISSMLPFVIWFGVPGGFAVGTMIEIVFGWFFAGLSIARMVEVKKHK